MEFRRLLSNKKISLLIISQIKWFVQMLCVRPEIVSRKRNEELSDIIRELISYVGRKKYWIENIDCFISKDRLESLMKCPRVINRKRVVRKEL